MKNIVLIGMPGSGKSTIGVLLAKTLGRKFIDTDLLIQETAGRLLQDIIDTDGTDTFQQLEEQAILGLHRHRAVIATGGSVVYSRRAMEHLKNHGVVVYLSIPFEVMEKRLKNIRTRGIVLHKGLTLHDMYNERVPLYHQYADITIACSDDHFEDVVSHIARQLKQYHT
ncbi:MAG: shikimate kinase [Methanomicrobiales archaeon]|nr:shikimate kinase [Methanomicrobiales archaeon]